jgi:hypothetical protein
MLERLAELFDEDAPAGPGTTRPVRRRKAPPLRQSGAA